MKAIILAGGFGTRLSEETTMRPKPMVEIGGKPMLWHIINIFSHHGIREFIIALGYKGTCIKEYFLNFFPINNDLTIDLSTGERIIHGAKQPKWKIHLIDTGLHTKTGGRLKRLEDWIDDNETFMFTYGDGVTDLDLKKLIEFHRSHGKIATVTTVRSPARFGRISFEGDRVKQFYEKSREAEGWINGGFFVLNKKVIDYIDDDQSIWEQEPIKRLSNEGQLMGYRHDGFWSCMDTLKEKNILEALWAQEKAPWKIWL